MKKILTILFVGALIVSCTPGGEKGATDTQKVETEESDIPKMPDLPAVPEEARVYFVNLNDGDTVTSPFYAEFGVEGMEIEPAGPINEGKGHHHVVINEGFTAPGIIVPADSTHIHYGGGQTGDTLNLPAGTHTLTLQFADGIHRSYGEQLSNSIEVTVE